MSPIQIGITTCEVGEVVAFEFHLPIPGAEDADARFPSLRADFIDGTAITTRGNEAVTLKVLLASLGIREVNTCPTKDAPASASSHAAAMDRAAAMSLPVSTVSNEPRFSGTAPSSSARPSPTSSRVVLPA
jgi:hypothetical protein